MKQVVLILVSPCRHLSSLCSVWSDSEFSTALVLGVVLCLEFVFWGVSAGGGRVHTVLAMYLSL